MPHSFNKIWIHAICATKERTPLIHQNIEQKVYQKELNKEEVKIRDL